MNTENLNWINIDTQLPKRGELCFIKRKGGNVYLGNRSTDIPKVTNPDISQECHWHGNPIDDIMCERYDLHFKHNFQDGTVSHWSPIIA